MDYYFELSNGIQKSPSDQKEYEGLTLPNGLKVLLCRDSTADKSAAGLNVGIGNLTDPLEVPGLFHFLEHMLFMGTKTYPDENEYSSFLSGHGGSSNAYTDDEVTGYSFDVQSEHLYEALKRFSQFFICPLMTESCLERELKAVDSEHQKNVGQDSWRMNQIERSTSSPLHAYHKFGTGNKETLDKPFVRDQLFDCYHKYYVANNMGLVVLGKQELASMKQWVIELFSAIPSTNPKPYYALVPLASYEPDIMPSKVFPLDVTNKIVYIVPCKDKFTVEVSWELFGLKKHFDKNPTSYVDHLFGHEGEGSILSLLKKKNLANELSAGLSINCKDFAIYRLSLDCTEKGVQREGLMEILEIIFDFGKLVRQAGPQERIFQEIQLLDEIQFRFQSPKDPFSFVDEVAPSVRLYSLETCLHSESVLKTFDSELTKQCLDALTPERARCYVSYKNAQKDHSELAWTKEKWYQAPYAVDDARLISELLRTTTTSTSNESHLFLPKPNPFLPTNFTLVARAGLKNGAALKSSKENLWKPPSRATGLPATLQVYYKTDETFLLPKALLKATIKIPNLYTSPRASVLAELSCALASEMLNEQCAYDAKLAGLQYNWGNSTRGFNLVVSGYNDKMSTLLENVMQVVLDIGTYAKSEERFHRQRDKYVRQLENFPKDNPYKIAYYHTSLVLNVPRWDMKDKLRTITDSPITLAELVTFMETNLTKGLNSSASVSCLAIGNVTRNSSIRLGEIVWNRLKFDRSYFPTPLPRVICLPRNHTLFVTAPCDNVNVAIEFYSQIGPEMVNRNAAFNGLMHHIAEEPCFNSLRTQQQLGYIVSLGTRREGCGVVGVEVLVQSPTYDVDVLWGRVLHFLDVELGELIRNMSDEEFKAQRDSCALKYVEKDLTLLDEAARWWEIINDENFDLFNKNFRISKDVKSITKNEFTDFYSKYFASKSFERRWMVTRVVNNQHSQSDWWQGKNGGKNHPILGGFHDHTTHLRPEDVLQFKESCALWGVNSYL